MHDVVVVDEDYANAGKHLGSICERGEEMLSMYCSLMEEVTESVVKSGATADALRLFVDYAKTLEGKLEAVCQRNKGTLERFVDAIDEADRDLF